MSLLKDQSVARLQLKTMFDSVDRFYQLLGPRNWICHDRLPWSKIEEMLARNPTEDEAEESIVEITDALVKGDYWWLNLNIDGLQQRRVNLDRARQHYIDGQFDSCTLVLVAVMDGFVNDFQTNPRKGLHARNPDEMVAWDSVVGHHQGLTSALKTFTKSCHKRQDEDVFEVHRHGIVHGMVVNYNNQIVATKAWNMLYAVVDWAKATEKAAEPVEPEPTWEETWGELKESAAYKRHQKDFTPTTHSTDDDEVREMAVLRRADSFLDSWANQRWGNIPQYADRRRYKGKPKHDAIKRSKQLLARTELTGYQLTEVTYPQASVAETKGTATVNDERQTLSIRWIYTNTDGNLLRTDEENGTWHIAIWNPDNWFEPLTDESE